MNKLLFLVLSIVSISFQQSLVTYNISLPNSSYTITGISYIQNTNWVQIAISGPQGGYTELYNITNTSATKLSSQPIENKTNSTYATNLINLPNSFLVAATVEPNYQVSDTFLSIWDTYNFQQVMQISNIGQAQTPWINDRVMLIAANPLQSTGQASIHIFNVVTGALVNSVKTDFENITSIAAAAKCLVITGQKKAYPGYNFIDVMDSNSMNISYSFNYSTPIASMSTFFRSFGGEKYYGNYVLIVWNALANATNNQVMVLNTQTGQFVNVTRPSSEVIQQCWAGDAFEATFVCQTHNGHRSVFQYFKNYAYVSSQTPTVLISDVAFHVENKKFYFSTSSTIAVWTLE